MGWTLVLISVYFAAVVAYSTTQLAGGAVEFIPWMLSATIFGGLAYILGRYGWRMARQPAAREGIG